MKSRQCAEFSSVWGGFLGSEKIWRYTFASLTISAVEVVNSWNDYILVKFVSEVITECGYKLMIFSCLNQLKISI